MGDITQSVIDYIWNIVYSIYLIFRRRCRTRSQRAKEKKEELTRIKIDGRRERFEQFLGKKLAPYNSRAEITAERFEKELNEIIVKKKIQTKRVAFHITCENETGQISQKIIEVKPHEQPKKEPNYDFIRNLDSDDESDDSIIIYEHYSELQVFNTWEQLLTSPTTSANNLLFAQYNEKTDSVKAKLIRFDNGEQRPIHVSMEIMEMLSNASLVSSMLEPLPRIVSPPAVLTYYKIMASQEEHERKIIIEFCHLLEKSKQLFNGLRELPPYGHKQWHVHFGKTFDVYTKLWKFQQQHRELLDTKYGLKRWQIGEIASKIGQLYYHFYLRTSDTAYLNEAYAFYYAIRCRCYYTRACREDRSELMVKKLRYYARFMVVCILLKKVKLFKELIKELSKQITEYGNVYDPDDEVEWSLVLDEAKAFVKSEPGIMILSSENIPVVVTHRLKPHSIPPIEIIPQMNLKLQEVLIIGSNPHQVKFSELTMDMFRILQVVEREPTGDMPYLFEEPPRTRYAGIPDAPIPKDDGPPRCETGNPHKFLLYKPSPNQVMVYLASACDELTPNGAVLLYISAEGHFIATAAAASATVASTSTAKPVEEGFDTSGLITTSKSDVYRDYNKEPRLSQCKSKEGQCLYPGDLHPFTRKPLFIIVDSDNSFSFQNLPRAFGQPLVTLMSPIHPLPALQERRHQGNLFSLFLQSPVAGLAMSCELDSITIGSYDRCQGILSSFMIETNVIVAQSRLDASFYAFLGDEFLRTLLFRYIFCEVTLRMHRGFRSRTNFPKCDPPLPEEIFDKASLVDLVLEIANCLMVRQCFHDTYMSGGNTNL